MSLLLDKGADVNLVGGRYGTALVAAAYGGKHGIVSLLLDKGADVNLVGGERGTALGDAIYGMRTDVALFLLDHGADAMRVGGSHSTTSGVYPSALDITHSESSWRVDPTLLARIKTLIGKQIPIVPGNPAVDSIVSRPPFPMP